MSAGIQETGSKREGSPNGTTSGSGTSTTTLVSGDKADKTTGGSKRLNFVRTGSFRNKHKVKQQDSKDSTDGVMSSLLGRGRSPGDSRAWRIRHFGYYDVQSVTVDRPSYQVAQGDPKQRLKKHTGASAALLTADGGGEDLSNGSELEVENNLVAVCPAFKNEIGGDTLHEGNVIERLRPSLSQDKKMRLCSRERAVLDGYFEDSNEYSEGEASEVFTIQAGNTFPIEFVDFGACYYRNYFVNKGQLSKKIFFKYWAVVVFGLLSLKARECTIRLS